MATEFSQLRELHNGAHYLAPTDLSLTRTKPRRVLLVGSCLADIWQSQIDCPCDFVLTNNLSQLPDAPPRPITDYDLQLVQIPLRAVVPDHILWHPSFLNIEAHEKAFVGAVNRLKQHLSMACFWNKNHGLLTLVTNFLVPQQNPMGRFAPRYDLRNPVYFVERLNVELSRELATYENVHLLDLDGISSVFGKKNIQDDAVLIQMHGSILGDGGYEKDQERIEPTERMTQHYGLYLEGFIAAVWHQAAAMFKTLHQEDAVKLVILDLDNTLWRGVVAEGEEIDGLTIEGWPLGLVEALSYLKKRGVILAIASQNDEAHIKALWSEIMRGRLALEDFAVVKINWNLKTETIQEILTRVNVLSRHTVFIDDNPVERAAVKAAFPDMRVLGQYPYYLKRILLWSPETQVPFITAESSQRTEMIKEQVVREEARTQMSRAEFLATLEIRVSVTEITSLEHPSFARAFELINKTNQFNTTGKRWTRGECGAYFEAGNVIHAFKVKDRFSDYGLVGCALVSFDKIDQFVMSCRIIGLDAEKQVIADIADGMRKAGAQQMFAQMIETKDNFPCRDLYAKTGFTWNDDVWIKPLDEK